MSLIQISIADGIRVNIYETDRFKSNYLCINFLMPLSEETASENALLSDVLSCGCEQYPTIAKMNDRLNYLYGTSMDCGCERIGEVQSLSLAFDFLRNEYTPDQTDVLGGVLDMVEQVLFHPYLENGVFSEKYVKSEQAKRIAEIESLIGNKRAYAAVRLIEEMCKDEPYRIRPSGTVDGVSKATPQSLFSRYQAMLQTAQIEIFFLGHCDKDALCSSLTSLFQINNRSFMQPAKTTVRACNHPLQTVTEQVKAEQSGLVIGFRGIPQTTNLPKFAAACVFNELYGGSPSSKLFMNVREKLSLCYTVRSSLHGVKGLMSVYAGIASENKEITQKEIFAQLSLCKEGQISDEEIALAKQSLTNAYRALSDRPLSIERFYLNRILAQDGHDITDFLREIQAVTKEDIQKAACDIQPDTVFFLEGVHKKGGEGNV